MTRLIAFVLAAVALFLTSAPAVAADPVWTVSDTSGPVVIVAPSGRSAAKRGVTLRPGWAVETGRSGRAVLVRGQEFVTVAPASRVVVPVQRDGLVQIAMDWGRALFQIEKKSTPHFGVRTPVLAAVVKGTTFRVTADAKGSKVEVLEGLVEVSNTDGSERQMVPANTRAEVLANGAGHVSLDEGIEPEVGPPAPGTPPLPVVAGTGEPSGPASPAAGVTSFEISTPVNSDSQMLAVLTRGLIRGSTGGEDAAQRSSREQVAALAERPASTPRDAVDTTGAASGDPDGKTDTPPDQSSPVAEVAATPTVDQPPAATPDSTPNASAPEPVSEDVDPASETQPVGTANDTAPAPQPESTPPPPPADNPSDAEPIAATGGDGSKPDADEGGKATSTGQSDANGSNDADDAKADKDKADKDKADKDKADKDKADKDKADKDKADKDKADKDKADKDKADKDKADKDKADKDKADKDKADKDKADKDKSDKDKSDKDKADKDKADKDKSDKDKADKDKGDKDKGDKDKGDKDKGDKDKGDKDKGGKGGKGD